MMARMVTAVLLMVAIIGSAQLAQAAPTRGGACLGIGALQAARAGSSSWESLMNEALKAGLTDEDLKVFNQAIVENPVALRAGLFGDVLDATNGPPLAWCAIWPIAIARIIWDLNCQAEGLPHAARTGPAADTGACGR